MKMDSVNAFHTELFSMMDLKPPISRAKMMSITSAGIKAIKLYKHVVQIVEKFIKTCKPEMKVPGLYVVDSIIRESRHQFGVDKDLFGPRFLRNLTVTFQNLYQCPADDKAKILRVLGLWQKNAVFSMDVIQPLMDLASTPVMSGLQNGIAVGGAPAPGTAEVPVAPITSASPTTDSPDLQNSAALAAVAQLLQSTQTLELQQILQTLQQNSVQSGSAPGQPHVSLPQTIPQSAPPTEQMNLHAPVLYQSPLAGVGYHDLSVAGEELRHSNANTVTYPPLSQHHQFPAQMAHVQNEDLLVINDNQDQQQHRSSPSRSPRRRPSHSCRSRSSSRTRRPRHHRSRSRSRSRDCHRRLSWSEERREEEIERERRLKGLPLRKRETLSVCSTTLWLGQLDKKTPSQKITNLIEEFGQIESVNMIPPRGCAYIVMVHRQDAHRALTMLSRHNVKLNQRSIKIAWAMNKGISAEFKQYWDVDRGVTYIPWSKVKVEKLDSYREGGTLDFETLNPEWHASVRGLGAPVSEGHGGPAGPLAHRGPSAAISQVPIGQPVGSLGVPFPIGQPPGAMTSGGPLQSFPGSDFRPTQGSAGALLHPPSSAVNMPSAHLVEDSFSDSIAVPLSQINAPGAPPMAARPAAGLLGDRPGLIPLRHPGGPPPAFMPHFPNDLPHPNMPPHTRPAIPPQTMSHSPNPMYRDPPPTRFRGPMPHPSEDYPPYEHPGGFEEEEDWEGRPYGEEGWDFGHDQPPDMFRNEPPFRGRGHRRGWDRPRGRGRFMNRHEGYD